MQRSRSIRPFCAISLFVLSLVGAACSSAGGAGLPLADGGSDPPDSAPTNDATEDPIPTADGGRRSETGTPRADAEPAVDLAAQYKELPVSGGTDAPVIASIEIRCASSNSELGSGGASSGAEFPSAFVRVVSVTDAQGVPDIDGPNQQLVLFSSLDGATPESHPFDIQTYGIYFNGYNWHGYFAGADGQSARDTWCGEPWWPGEVTVTDETGHVTKSKVRIPIVQ